MSFTIKKYYGKRRRETAWNEDYQHSTSKRRKRDLKRSRSQIQDNQFHFRRENKQDNSFKSLHKKTSLGIGYTQLKQLSEITSAENLMINLLPKKDDFQQLMQRDELKNDWVLLLIKISSQLCKCIRSENKNEFLGLIVESKFIKSILQEYLIVWSEAKQLNDDVIADLMMLFKTLIESYPRVCLRLPLDTLKDAVTASKNIDYELEIKEMLQRRSNFISKFVTKGDEASSPTNNKSNKTSEDFRNIPTVPTAEDMFMQTQNLKKIKKFCGYESEDEYLSIQYRLLREDLVYPLREMIKEIVLETPRRDGKTKIYRNIRLLSPNCTRLGITYKIKFETDSMKSIPWKHAKKLLFGNLLCFSKDHFDSIVFATVADRDPVELENGFVNIRFVSSADVKYFDTNDKLIMVESPSYFEAYKHVLNAMKKIQPEDIGMSDYIVKCNSEVLPPKYLRETEGDVLYDLKDSLNTVEDCNVALLDSESWPTFSKTALNESQLNAIKHCLTKEFALVQGPPGTGKTYVGTRIAHALLKNKVYWKDGPMLIVCYTNHALDQFLKGLIDYRHHSLVRIGGRCSEEMAKYSLNNRNFREQISARFNLKNNFRTINKSLSEPYSRRRELSENIGQKITLKSWLENNKGNLASISYVYDFEKLGGVMTPSQHSSFVNVSEEFGIDERELMDKFLEESIALNRSENDGAVQKEWKESNENYVEVRGEADMLVERHILDIQQYQLLDSATRQKNTERNTKNRTMNAHIPMMSSQESEYIKDPWNLSSMDRLRLYNYWVTLYVQDYQDDEELFQTELEDFEKICQEISKKESVKDLTILRQFNIIGMTTTGAAKYSEMLKFLKPAIVIVEEAAEVLEAHVITALTKDVDHLVLIGDHKQLQPNPSVYRLAEKFGLNISLFQRMINNGIECHMLGCQHRMRPEISFLLRHIYPNLKDHPKVKEYPNVRGVAKNVFFINHNFEEHEIKHIKSKANLHEAQFIKELCAYLLKQGYLPHQITVLAAYTGQIIQMKNLMDKESFKGLRISSIDNFQGEENDIILLSLVRNNAEGQVGFLRKDNRVCVALSRAKIGLYVLGNFHSLSHESNLWKSIISDANEKDMFGRELTLFCENHPSQHVNVSKAEHFKLVPEGGCLLPCDFRRDCGHACPRVCHSDDRDHKSSKCFKLCNKRTCEKKHRCRKICHYKLECGPCQFKINVQLPKCDHKQTVECSADVNKVICKDRCRKKRLCGHTCDSICGEACEMSKCMVRVKKMLRCGHEDMVPCSTDIENHPCNTPCNQMLKCEHMCRGKCSTCKQGRLHRKCFKKCERTLVCSHVCQDVCSNCPPCAKHCENKCEHSKCWKLCEEICAPCMDRCEARCKHSQCNNLCGEMCDRTPCNEPCKIKKKCGHPCIGLCGEICPKLCRVCDEKEVCSIFFGWEDEPQARFIQLQDCEHFFEKKGLDEWMSSKQDENEIQLKKCPKCNTVIRVSRRYKNMIKKTIDDIEGLKKLMASNANIIERKEAAFKKCLHLDKNKRHATHSGEEIEINIFTDFKELLQDKDDVIKASRSSKEPSVILAARLIRADKNEVPIIDNQLEILIKLTELRDKVNVNEGIDALNRRIIDKDISDLEMHVLRRLTVEQLEDCVLEFNRIETHLSFSLVGKDTIDMVRENSKDGKRFDRITWKFKNGKLLSSDDLKFIQSFLDKEIYAERRMILKAMNFKTKGRWFKCSNGHYYCIGECGGAMEKSKCPECDEVIGGTNHKLVATSSLASEIDGAEYPAWSDTANNLLNLDPEQLANLQR